MQSDTDPAIPPPLHTHTHTSCQIKTFKLWECLPRTFPFPQQHIAEIIEDISSHTVTKRWKARRGAVTAPLARGGNEGLSKVSPCLSRIICGDLKPLPSQFHSLWRVLYPQWFTDAQALCRVMNEHSSQGVRVGRWLPHNSLCPPFIFSSDSLLVFPSFQVELIRWWSVRKLLRISRSERLFGDKLFYFELQFSIF